MCWLPSVPTWLPQGSPSISSRLLVSHCTTLSPPVYGTLSNSCSYRQIHLRLSGAAYSLYTIATVRRVGRNASSATRRGRLDGAPTHGLGWRPHVEPVSRRNV